MPKTKKNNLSARFKELKDATEKFVELYETRHNALYTLSSIRPLNQERIRAAQLIQKISTDDSSNLGEHAPNYKGKSHYFHRLELHFSALKGALVLTLLKINQEDTQYRSTWTALLFKPTPISQTALFSLALDALGVKSLEDIKHDEMEQSLTGLSQYLTIMQNNQHWGDIEIPKLLTDIEQMKNVLVAEQQQPASAAAI